VTLLTTYAQQSRYGKRKKIFVAFVVHHALRLYAGIMTAIAVKKTLSEEVYDRLRTELLRGDYLPGKKLLIGEIAGRYGVSASVLREALARLAQQGLVHASPQRGFSVPRLSVEGLEDLSLARRLIETTALRESIKDGDLGWESAVLGAHHRLQNTQFTDSHGHLTEEWDRAHREFHHVLLAGGRSATLTEVATGLRDRTELFVHWSRELTHDDSRDVPAEHRRIADLAVARDAEGAAQALDEHIRRSVAALSAYAQTLAE
jgi:DNA-binding GntR family transcriptional regulator